tara:strand:+ start:1354 stop:1461 length:108 start_codon:yes stop_codon:yes gene_type:complete
MNTLIINSLGFVLIAIIIWWFWLAPYSAKKHRNQD